TTFMLRNQSYTDKVSYEIDVVQTEYDKFIEFLNKTTAGNYEIQTEDSKMLPFDISTD
ncbi:DUF1949 domain-containing protein, partial [Pseudomonas aeruginosa]|nr:DUF1949 domain-containing protein [Pseudomonas aeruginosa]